MASREGLKRNRIKGNGYVVCPVCKVNILKGNLLIHLMDHLMDLNRAALHYIKDRTCESDTRAICIERKLTRVMNLVEDAA